MWQPFGEDPPRASRLAAVELADTQVEPDRLRRLACPTLLLQVNPDLGGALSATEVTWAQSLLPRGILVSMPDVGHGLHSDVDGQPARVCQLVADFLDTP